MSTQVTGVQWDKPYGWAPIQMMAVEGMRRYGFKAAADRVSKEFLAAVLDNYRREGTIREKYNVVTRSTESSVTAGYQANVVGFGWTNAAFLVLLHELPRGARKELLRASADSSSGLRRRRTRRLALGRGPLVECCHPERSGRSGPRSEGPLSYRQFMGTIGVLRSARPTPGRAPLSMTESECFS